MAKDIAGYADRQMMKDFDRMLDSFFGHGERMPSVDIRQDKDSYVVRARVAGFRPDELKVDVEDHVLHISGQRCEEERTGRKYITRERGCESFERSFTLPAGGELQEGCAGAGGAEEGEGRAQKDRGEGQLRPAKTGGHER